MDYNFITLWQIYIFLYILGMLVPATSAQAMRITTNPAFGHDQVGSYPRPLAVDSSTYVKDRPRHRTPPPADNQWNL